ncbi:MAG: hypothetical protein AAGE52_10010 [Myxococcota bacterium]
MAATLLGVISVAQILRRSPGTALYAVLTPVTLFVGLSLVLSPLFGGLFGLLLLRHLRAAEVGTASFRWKTALFVSLGFLLMLFAAGLGGTVTRSLAWGAAAGVVAGPLIVVAVISPLAFFPVAALEVDTASDALRASLEGWGLVPFRRRVAILATTLLPWAVLGVLFTTNLSEEAWLSAMVAVSVIVVPFLSAQLVSTWSGVRVDALDFEATERMPRGLGIFTALVTLALVAGLGMTVVAMLRPLSMNETRPVASRMLQPPGSGWDEGPIAITGTTLRVSRAPDGVRIEAADGGGVGLVRWRRHPSEIRVVRHGTRYRVHARQGGARAFVDINDEGVRAGDGLVDRFDLRVGWLGGLLIVLAMLGVVASIRAFAGLLRARALREIKGSEDPTAKPKERRVWEGRFSLEGTATVLGGTLRVEHASIAGSDMRLALPPEGVRIRGQVAPRDGELVALVGAFTQLSSSLREAAPWPTHAVLIVGGRDQAVKSEVRNTARGLVLALTPTLVVCIAWVMVLADRVLTY